MKISGVGISQTQWTIPKGMVDNQTVNQSSGLKIPQDQLDLSPVARMMAELDSISANDPSRNELISRIRSEIEQGIYDTDEKLEMALTKFLQDLQSDTDSSR